MRRIVIIGGGIVGCHIALRCAKDGHETYLLEKNSQLGQETSSRNSCVLHAGIYYKPGSLKARLCVEGNARSREFFEAFGVGYRATGKYIISRTPDEDGEIERLHENARANGVPGMERAGAAEVASAVPYIASRGGLMSKSTALIDVGDYLSVMKGLLFQEGVHCIMGCRALSIGHGAVETDRGTIECDIAVNAAGLSCDEIARSCGIDGYEVVPLKGDYYCTRSIALQVPVYPVPNHTHKTLGVHLTPTFGSEVLVGPSETKSSGKYRYEIETPREVFADSLRGMLDARVFDSLEIYEGYSGNRPRAYLHGERCDDFVFIKQRDDIIHLIGIESPGLTSAPAIARHVCEMM